MVTSKKGGSGGQQSLNPIPIPAAVENHPIVCALLHNIQVVAREAGQNTKQHQQVSDQIALLKRDSPSLVGPYQTRQLQLMVRHTELNRRYDTFVRQLEHCRQMTLTDLNDLAKQQPDDAKTKLVAFLQAKKAAQQTKQRQNSSASSSSSSSSSTSPINHDNQHNNAMTSSSSSSIGHARRSTRKQPKPESKYSNSDSVSMHSDDSHDDHCFGCKGDGQLLCCDTCTKAWHLKCVGIESVPDGIWSCPKCLKKKTRGKKRKLDSKAATTTNDDSGVAQPKFAPVAKVDEESRQSFVVDGIVVECFKASDEKTSNGTVQKATIKHEPTNTSSSSSSSSSSSGAKLHGSMSTS